MFYIRNLLLLTPVHFIKSKIEFGYLFQTFCVAYQQMEAVLTLATLLADLKSYLFLARTCTASLLFATLSQTQLDKIRHKLLTNPGEMEALDQNTYLKRNCF